MAAPPGIVLIGPTGIGKTTVSKLLAGRLGVPRVGLDDLRSGYYREIGYDEEYAARLRREQGFAALADYWKLYNLHAVERVVADHPGCIIDFGAGHSVYEDDDEFRRAQAALTRYGHVVFLLPDPDLEVSLEILAQRDDPYVAKFADFNAHFMRHHSNWDLATLVVYTGWREPDEICDEIMVRLGLAQAGEENSMADRSVVIIGAGLAGLAAGVYSQMNGYRATILEHASQPGGVAVGWRHGAYHIDGGIHFLMGHRPGGALYRLYEELGAVGPGTSADMTSYGDFTDEASGRRLHVTSDLDRLVENWAACSPADRRIMSDTVGAARAFAKAGAFDLGLGDPPELAGRLGMAKQMWGMRKVFRFFGGKHNQAAAERSREIRDPFLRDIYANLFMPEVPTWFLYMVLGLLTDGQMGLLLDGSTGFVAGIERRFHDLGGTIRYGATVDQISVVGNRATGAHVVSGDWVIGDAVISAADGYSTVFGMLGGRYADQATRARYRDWRVIRPMVMISYGVNRSFAGEPHLRAFRLAQPIVVGQQNVSLLALRIFNYSDRFAPPGKTVIQATFDAEWDYWRGLRDDKAAYLAEKECVAAEVLSRLEAHFPGLAHQVEVTDVATPYTTWRYTLNREGAYEGWMPTPANLMTTLPRTLPGLAGFYMAGQWVVPGGGVPTCLASGRDAVRIMADRDGVPFRTQVG